MPQAKSDLTCIAFTIGTAMLAVVQWLQELRLKLTKNGGYAGQALGEQSALLLLRGKAGRSEVPPGAIADAVNALMEAVHIPALATINTQVRAFCLATTALSPTLRLSFDQRPEIQFHTCPASC
jgi:hypothetical protein